MTAVIKNRKDRLFTTVIEYEASMSSGESGWRNAVTTLEAQEDIFIYAVSGEIRLDEIDAESSAAADVYMFVSELSQAAEHSDDGLVARCVKSVSKALQAAVTPAEIIVDACAQVYIPLPKPILLAEGEDLALHTFEKNSSSDAITVFTSWTVYYSPVSN